MAENREYLPTPYPCRECHAGMMQPRYLTYFTWLGSELITVPHFPAWICDVCGKREYDEKAIQWLNMLLDPNAGRPTRNHHKPAMPLQPRDRSHRSIRDS